MTHHTEETAIQNLVQFFTTHNELQSNSPSEEYTELQLPEELHQALEQQLQDTSTDAGQQKELLQRVLSSSLDCARYLQWIVHASLYLEDEELHTALLAWLPQQQQHYTASIGEFIYKKAHAAGTDTQRVQATQILVALGPQSTPHLFRLRTSKTESIRNASKQAFVDFGLDALPYILDVIQSGGEELQSVALSAIGRLGSEAHEAIPVLLDFLKSDNENNKPTCISALGKIGEGQPQVAEAIVELLQETSNESVQQLAISVLGKHKVRNALPVILKYISSTSDDVKKAARKAFERMEEPLGPYLAKWLESTDAEERKAAMDAHSSEELKALSFELICTLLQDLDNDVRLKAIHTWGELAQTDEHICFLLSWLLNDTNYSVAYAAATEFEKLQSAQWLVLDAMFTAFQHDHWKVREVVAKKLALFTEQQDSIRAKLFEKLEDSDCDVRNAVISSLESIGGIGEQDAPYVPNLIKSLEADTFNTHYQSKIVSFLAEIGEKAHTATQFCLDRLSSDDSDLQAAARKALAQFGPQSIPTLLQALESRPDLQEDAHTILESMSDGPVQFLIEYAAQPEKCDETRLLAYQVAEKIGLQPVVELETIYSMLQEENPEICLIGTILLGQETLEEHKAWPFLQPLLDTDDSELCAAATHALGQMKTLDATLRSSLSFMFWDATEHADVRSCALEALWNSTTEPTTYLPHIRHALQDDSWILRWMGLTLLTELPLAQRPTDYFSLLETVQHDPYSCVQQIALGEIIQNQIQVNAQAATPQQSPAISVAAAS